MPDGDSMRLELITWNVNRQSADVLDALGPGADTLDLILLQEVTSARRDGYRERLASLGFRHFVHGDPGAQKKSYGNVIASKHRLVQLPPPPGAPYPQLLVHARLELPAPLALHVVCVHAPNGSNNGWDKIRTLRGARTIVTDLGDAPVVVAGDFNEPRYVAGTPVRSFAWLPDQDWDELRLRPWARKNARGVLESEPRESWDEVVRWFFDARSGLRHAHWVTHGEGTIHASHRTKDGEAPDRWFDHVLVSNRVRVVESSYRDDLRALTASDHSGFWVTVDVEADAHP